MKKESNSLIVKLAIAWTIALIPLCWGLYNTLLKAMPLFSN
jgi:hypothetical protein